MGDGGTDREGAAGFIDGPCMPIAVLVRATAARRAVSSTTLSNKASCLSRLPDVGISVTRDRYGDMSPTDEPPCLDGAIRAGASKAADPDDVAEAVQTDDKAAERGVISGEVFESFMVSGSGAGVLAAPSPLELAPFT
jgi:hypothetical protein